MLCISCEADAMTVCSRDQGHAEEAFICEGRPDKSVMLVQIVELLNIVYCLAELTEFAAFLHLRRKAPHLRRPFKIALPTWGCFLMLTPATALLLALIAQPILDADFMVSVSSIFIPSSSLVAVEVSHCIWIRA